MGKKGKMKLMRMMKAKPVDPEIMNKRKLKKEWKKLERARLREIADIRNKSLRPIDWPSLNLPPPKKDIYQEYANIIHRSPEEVERYRKEKHITVKGDAANPVTSFEEIRFPDFCMKKIRANFKEPTAVQAQSWPIVMSGHNMVCIASDDKARELAYLLPAICHIRAQPPPEKGEGSIVLILSPNTVSAEIIKGVVEKYTSEASISFTCLVTGASKKEQVQDVSICNHIIIGTPSRVSCFLIERHISFKRCTFVVLSEVDRMMGSELQVKQVLSQTRPDRQILMFVSAAYPGMPEFVNEFIGDHIEINVDPGELAVSYVVTQHIDIGAENEKGPKLRELLLKIYADQQPFRRGKIMIFVATKRRVDKVRKFITSFLEPCSAIHSDKNKVDRDLMMNDFKSGKRHILITTDSSGRDIILDRIKYVINFDYPLDPKDYIRRLNRIDRGIPGHSFTFFTRRDAMFGQHLIEVLRKTKQFVSGGLLHMARLGSDPTKNSIPKYFPRTRSGLMVVKKTVPSASGKVVGGGSDDLELDSDDGESDGDEVVSPASAGANITEFGSRGGGSGFGSDTSGNRSIGGFRNRRGRGLHAGGGAGFGNDSGDFQERGGASGFGYGGAGSGFGDSRSGVGFSGKSDVIRADNGSGFGAHSGGLHSGGGTGFGNMGGNIGFGNRGGGSGFRSEGGRDRLSGGALSSFGSTGFENIGNDTVYGGDAGTSFRNTAGSRGFGNIGNGTVFAGDAGTSFRGSSFDRNDRGFDSGHGHGNRDDKSRFGNIGGVGNFGGGTRYDKRDCDASSSRSSFAAERDRDSLGFFNRRNDESSNRFGDYGGSGDRGNGHFNRESNDDFTRRGSDSNFGSRGDDHNSQGNDGFVGSGGNRVREFGTSDSHRGGGFDNRDNGNFSDARGDGGFRNRGDSNFNMGDNAPFNNRNDSEFNRSGSGFNRSDGGFNRSDGGFNRRDDLNHRNDSIFTRRDDRHIGGSGRGGYSGGQEERRYNPYAGGDRGYNSGYGR